MSTAEKGTVDYLEELLKEAEESGIVTYATVGGEKPFDGYTVNADLANELLLINGLKINDNPDAVNNMHVDDIKVAIDQIFTDERMTDEDRLAALQAMRSNNVQRDLIYGQYIENYASALTLLPVLPVGGESPAERDRIARNYLTVRDKLCAWMLSMYPDCLCLVEKNLEAFAYLHEKEQILIGNITRKNHLYDLSSRFAIPFVAEMFTRDVTAFRTVNRNGQLLDIFDNNPDFFSQKDLKYWEAAMLMQYEDQASRFTPAVLQLVQENCDRYPANFRMLRDSGALDAVKEQLPVKIEKWKLLLTDIRSDTKMDFQRRNTIENIYSRLVKSAEEAVWEPYKMWLEAQSDSQSVSPKEEEQMVSEPEKKQEAIPVTAAPAAQNTSAPMSAFPAAYVNRIIAMSPAERLNILKSLPDDRRMVLIGQLPVDQMEAAMAELF